MSRQPDLFPGSPRPVRRACERWIDCSEQIVRITEALDCAALELEELRPVLSPPLQDAARFAAADLRSAQELLSRLLVHVRHSVAPAPARGRAGRDG